jgi:putative AdoMet-dependent methyltransferase
MLDEEGFDLWADSYDESVRLSEEKKEYPFAGYRDVLGVVYRRVRRQGGARILDIGFGTGTLSSRLYADGCQITGLDFSEKMIRNARKKMPKAELILWDFSQGLPEGLKNRKFDDIISTYALHHMADAKKAALLRMLWGLLEPGGQILVGDISFRTRCERVACREKNRGIWDSSEYYFTVEEFFRRLKGLPCTYEAIPPCAGILTIARKP